MKAVVQQVEEIDDKVTEIEKRAYWDLCEQAGCVEVHYINGFKAIANEDALQFFKKNK